MLSNDYTDGVFDYADLLVIMSLSHWVIFDLHICTFLLPFAFYLSPFSSLLIFIGPIFTAVSVDSSSSSVNSSALSLRLSTLATTTFTRSPKLWIPCLLGAAVTAGLVTGACCATRVGLVCWSGILLLGVCFTVNGVSLPGTTGCVPCSCFCGTTANTGCSIGFAASALAITSVG